MSVLKPAASYIEIVDGVGPILRGSRCDGCGTIFLGERNTCGRCGARGCMARYVLGTRGTLHCFTIVYRSYPGINVPFVSAIVDLEGGGSVKGNLLEVPLDPSAISFGMRVDVVFRDAGCASPEAAGHVAHFFVPEQESAHV